MEDYLERRAKIPEIVIASTLISLSLIIGLLFQGEAVFTDQFKFSFPFFSGIAFMTIVVSIIALWTREEKKFNNSVLFTLILFLITISILLYFAYNLLYA